MKYIKLFENKNDYDAFTSSTVTLSQPNVSLVSSDHSVAEDGSRQVRGQCLTVRIARKPAIYKNEIYFNVRFLTVKYCGHNNS